MGTVKENEKRKNSESIYRESLDRLHHIDLKSRAKELGMEYRGDELRFLFYGVPYAVSTRNVVDLTGKEINYTVSTLICKYLLHSSGEIDESGELVTFREFKDAGPLAGYFIENTQKTIENEFSGRMEKLIKACLSIGGVIRDDSNDDVSIKFNALPRIPIYLRYNDKDDEFPAQCSVLFRRSAEKYLDLESLTVLGTYLVGNLINANQKSEPFK